MQRSLVNNKVASGDISFTNAKNCAQFFTPGPQSLGLSELPAGHVPEVVTSRLKECVLIKNSKIIFSFCPTIQYSLLTNHNKNNIDLIYTDNTKINRLSQFRKENICRLQP